MSRKVSPGLKNGHGPDLGSARWIISRNPSIFNREDKPKLNVDGFKHQDEPFSSFHYLASRVWNAIFVQTLACWEFPNPSNHTSCELRVFAKRLFRHTLCSEESKKRLTQGFGFWPFPVSVVFFIFSNYVFHHLSGGGFHLIPQSPISAVYTVLS